MPGVPVPMGEETGMYYPLNSAEDVTTCLEAVLAKISEKEASTSTQPSKSANESKDKLSQLLAQFKTMTLARAAAEAAQGKEEERRRARLNEETVTFDPRFLAMTDKFNAQLEADLNSGRDFGVGKYNTLSHHPSAAPKSVCDKDGKPFNTIVVFSSQPQSGYPGERLDGQTECIFKSMDDKRLLVDVPGYPHPLPREPSMGGFVIKDINGRGMGMVATRDYALGDMIASERPLLICCVTGRTSVPRPEDPNDPSYQSYLVKAKEESFAYIERMLEQAVERMDEPNRSQFLALSNCHTDEVSPPCPPLMGIVRTNGFLIHFAKGETEFPYSSVFNNLSRVNHSCSHNATSTWDPVSVSRQLYALRPIAKGEEITTTYMGNSTPYEKRKGLMQGYRITCDCKACSSPQSYLARLDAVKDKENVSSIMKWCTNPALPDDLLLKPTMGLLELIEKEGQQGHPAYRRVLFHLALIYTALGDDATAWDYLEKRRLLDKTDYIHDDEPHTHMMTIRIASKKVGKGKGKGMKRS
ncbi:hypothetical protein ONZ45_g10762 [Pleurotus djamor]|nr:hypothetical protein ONZ45_g10762 [Pleurotus djamor]